MSGVGRHEAGSPLRVSPSSNRIGGFVVNSTAGLKVAGITAVIQKIQS